jgi:hypothetical protein
MYGRSSDPLSKKMKGVNVMLCVKITDLANPVIIEKEMYGNNWCAILTLGSVKDGYSRLSVTAFNLVIPANLNCSYTDLRLPFDLVIRINASAMNQGSDQVLFEPAYSSVRKWMHWQNDPKTWIGKRQTLNVMRDYIINVFKWHMNTGYSLETKDGEWVRNIIVYHQTGDSYTRFCLGSGHKRFQDLYLPQWSENIFACIYKKAEDEQKYLDRIASAERKAKEKRVKWKKRYEKRKKRSAATT